MVRISINEKLVLSFVLIGTFAIVLVTSVTFYYQKRALLGRTFEQLTSLCYVKKKIVEDYFEHRINDVELIASSGSSPEKLKAAIEGIMMANRDYTDYELISDEQALKETGLELSSIPEFAFIRESAGESGKQASDIMIGKAFFDQGRFNKLLILKISVQAINRLVYEDNPQSGLGKSGETYLVGSDFYMRSNSRFDENSYLKTMVKTEGVLNALEGREGTGVFIDYRGIQVLSSYTPLSIPGLNWVLLAEIDYKEAMIPIDNSRSTIMFISIILMTITFLVAFLLSKTISAPIVKLKDASINVGEGNFDLQLERNSNDEIGELTDTFNGMITRLKSQTQVLHEREERLKHFYEATNDGIILHFDNKPLLFNQAICKLTGYNEEEIYRKGIDDLILNYNLVGRHRFREAAVAIESILIRKDLSRLNIEIQETKIEYEGKEINATVIRDISKRKSVEHDLKIERRKRLRAVIDGQDIERQRLSRELHDGLGQKLIATKLKLEMAKDKHFSESEGIIREVGEEFDKTIDEVRRISNNLMPAALEEFGISAALRLISEEVGEKKNMKVSFESRGEFSFLTRRTRIYLFRIAQEALNNIVKHADAKSLKLSIVQQDHKVELRIEDDGKGFDIKGIHSHASNGLPNMRERVNLLQGSLEVFSQVGKGTLINVSIPLDNL